MSVDTLFQQVKSDPLDEAALRAFIAANGARNSGSRRSLEERAEYFEGIFGREGREFALSLANLELISHTVRELRDTLNDEMERDGTSLRQSSLFRLVQLEGSLLAAQAVVRDILSSPVEHPALWALSKVAQSLREDLVQTLAFLLSEESVAASHIARTWESFATVSAKLVQWERELRKEWGLPPVTERIAEWLRIASYTNSPRATGAGQTRISPSAR